MNLQLMISLYLIVKLPRTVFRRFFSFVVHFSFAKKCLINSHAEGRGRFSFTEENLPCETSSVGQQPGRELKNLKSSRSAFYDALPRWITERDPFTFNKTVRDEQREVNREQTPAFISSWWVLLIYASVRDVRELYFLQLKWFATGPLVAGEMLLIRI